MYKRQAPDRWAVNGVSFSMGAGEILGLVGESGSGKSVTAMSVSGLLPRDKTEVQGSITLDGREILTCPEQDVYKRQVWMRLSPYATGTG